MSSGDPLCDIAEAPLNGVEDRLCKWYSGYPLRDGAEEPLRGIEERLCKRATRFGSARCLLQRLEAKDPNVRAKALVPGRTYDGQ